MRVSTIAFVAFALLSSLGIGCGEAGLGDCPSDSAAAEAAGQKIVEASCNYCHGSQVAGSARQGAPDNLNFDVLATAKSEAEEMYSEAESGSMPPSGTKITGTDLENMRVWLACGAKDTTP